MTIQKNVSGQRLHFLMVDSTDFATPETGINTTNQYLKDNGGWSTCSNTESEMSSGLYRITLAATETNAAVVTYKFTGAGCAKQFITVYPEAGYAAGISDLISNVSNVISTLDDPLLDPITSILAKTTSILTDTATTLDDKLDSILVDTGTTLENRTVSIVNQTSQTLSTVDAAVVITIGNKITSILEDTATTVDNKVDSILAKTTSILTDTGTTLENRTTSIVNQTSQTLSTLDGPLTAYLSDLNSGLDLNSSRINSTLVDTRQITSILSTLDGPITAYLSDLNSGLDLNSSRLSSILVDTGTTLNNRQTSIVDLVSDILSTLDDMGLSHLSAILSTIDGPVITTIGNKITSILADTATTIPATLSDLNSGLDLNSSRINSVLVDTREISNLGTAGISAILSTIDGPITAYLSDLNSGLDVAANKITSILTDTGTTLENRTVSIVDQTSAIKAKTDKLTFTSGNDVDANIKKINDTPVIGDGGATPWGP